MPIAQEKLEELLRVAFPSATLEIIDTVGDQDHYSVTIVDKVFAGKSRVEQHKMVNAALAGHLGGALHALQIKTLAS